MTLLFYTEMRDRMTIAMAYRGKDFVVVGVDSNRLTYAYISPSKSVPIPKNDAQKLYKVNDHTVIAMAADDADLAPFLCSQVRKLAGQYEDVTEIAQKVYTQLAKSYRTHYQGTRRAQERRRVMLLLAGFDSEYRPLIFMLDSPGFLPCRVQGPWVVNGATWWAEHFCSVVGRIRLELERDEAVNLIALSMGKTGMMVKGAVQPPYRIAVITQDGCEDIDVSTIATTMDSDYDMMVVGLLSRY